MNDTTATLERAVIGLALSADPAVMLDLEGVRPQHFADLRHAALWELIRRVGSDGRADVLTVAGALPSLPPEDRQGIDDVYLLDCLHEAPAAGRVMAASYADQLRDSAGHRDLEAALIRAGQLLEATPDPVEAEGLIRGVLDEASPDTQRVGALVGDTLADTLETIGQPGRVIPTPWAGLNDLLGGWRPGALYVVGARPGVGKALALDTPIPTPTGWTTMGDIRPGDAVLGPDGLPTTVTFATPVMLDHPCYRVEFSDGTSVVADAEHQWTTEDRASRKARAGIYRTITTNELAATVRVGSDNRANHSLPDVDPLDLPDADLPLDPYVLGYWLGDGTARTAQVTAWKRDAPHLLAALDRAGYYHAERDDNGSCVRVTFSTQPIRRGGVVGDSAMARLRALSVVQNKHVPGMYLRASYRQRLALLRGLLDSDGSVSRSGHVEYTTVDEPLARGVMELMRTLGLRPTCKTRRVAGRDEAHSTCYRIHAPVTREHMTLSRKADRLPEVRRPLRRYVTAVVPVESVPVRCLQVSNATHLYLAGDGMVPTHNTVVGLQAAYGLAHTGPVAVSSLEMPQREVHSRLLAHAGQVPLGALNGMSQPTGADWDRIRRAAEHLRTLPISVDDRSSVTVLDVTTHARLLARHGQLAGVVVDYLQLMSAPRGDRRSRQEVVAEQSRQLKILAGELDCPVIALSQLNRQSEARGDGRPTLADLRESGAIEQDADVVVLLHVPTEGGAPDESRLDALVAKNRHGRTGGIRLARSGATATVSDLEWRPAVMPS